MSTNTISTVAGSGGSVDVDQIQPQVQWLDAVALMAFVFVFAGTLLGGSEFSHLHVSIGPIPLYVTDAFLLLWAMLRARAIPDLVRRVPLAISIPICAFALIGLLHLAVGLATTTSRVAQLRDFMVVGYAAFTLVGVDFTRSVAWVKRLYLLVAIAALPIVATGFINLLTKHSIEITTSGTERALPIAEGLYLIMAGFVCGVAIRLGWRPRWAFVAILAISLLGLLLVQSRSIFLAVPPVIAIYFAAYRLKRRQTAMLLGGSLAVAGLLVVLALSHYLPAYLGARLESFSNLGADPNATWRLSSWSIAIGLARQHPLTGMGFGELHLLPYGIAPHNSLISIFYQIGVPGELAFVAINVAFYIVWYRAYRELLDIEVKGIVLIALVWQVAGLTVALFNVALEGPFMAMYYWLSIGLAVGVWRLARRPTVDASTSSPVGIMVYEHPART